MEHLKTLASFSESNTDSVAVASERCLSDDDILAFAKGELPPRLSETVHAHLDTCIVCQQLVIEAVHALDAEPISEATPPSWSAVFQLGALIAKRYRILRMIDRGGMGEVYEAFDTILHERVALKTVTATHCDSADAMRLLKAEVQVARRIGHPNVCRIFDLGTHVTESSRSEIQFLVMEFIDGESLGKKLRQNGALPVDVAHSVAHQLLHGLAAAHEAGVLHRDFKSDNVMLRSEISGKVTAVILDFGLAKVLNESGSLATTQQHQSQAMVGTLGYMAPEQIEGQPLTPASDIYAFGVVWFEMLTGRLPFAAQTPVASAVARLNSPPEPASKYNPRVPVWIDTLVMRCLSRHRESRFISAEAVLEALAAGPASEQPRALKRAWRLRLPTAAALLAGGIFPLGISLMPSKPKIPTARAELTHTAPPQVTIMVPVAFRTEDKLTPDVPPIASQSFQPKPNNAVKKRPAFKRTSTPEVPTPEATPIPVAAPESEPLVAPSSTPSTGSTLPKPDWLPLSTTRNRLEAHLQIE